MTQSTNLSATHPLVTGQTANSRLVRAYRGERSDATPVWFMRQAGRSLPEYRKLRIGTDMLASCLNPEMAAEITLQPVRRHRVDAGIFFSDIVVPLKVAGVEVKIAAGRGPVFARCYDNVAAITELTSIDLGGINSSFAPITDAVARVTAELDTTPLIGFAGAPFTLAAYLVAGGPSKDQHQARVLMHSDPGAWRELLYWCADLSGQFLRAQLLAGASAAQLFDSWAGGLSLADYQLYVAEASVRMLSHIRGLRYSVAGVVRDISVVHFGVGTGELLRAMLDVGADVIGVDYRVPLDVAVERIGLRNGERVPLQGNLDPVLLDAPWPVLATAAKDVLRRAEVAPAHVFNLGHGVPPETKPEVLTRLVELVHEVSA